MTHISKSKYFISIIIIIAPLQCLNKTELTVLTLARPFTYFYAKTPSPDTITLEAYQSLKERDKLKFLEQKTNELTSEIILLKNENLALVNKLKSVSDFRQIAPSGINIKENYQIVLAEVVIKSDVSAWRRSFRVRRSSSEGSVLPACAASRSLSSSSILALERSLKT